MVSRLLAVVAVLLLTGCGPQTREITMGELNDSGQTGKATLTQDGNNVRVDIDIKVGTDTGSQAAHIHEGDCPGLGDIFLGLESLTNGKSTTVLENVKLDALKNHAINIHNSQTPARYVSCGEIR